MLVPITRLNLGLVTSPRERRNRPLLTAWGLRLTHIILALAIMAQAPDLGDLLGTRATEEQLEMITAENARCKGKCPLKEICVIEIDQARSETSLLDGGNRS